MSLSYNRHFLTSASYEPEGIYLLPPLEGPCRIVQGWGENPDYHGAFTYNGVRLKGHPGLDLAAKPGSAVHAADAGRVTEISIEVGGFGRYVKIEHRWGESLYALLGDILVESGQSVERGAILARTDLLRRRFTPHLHFAIRVKPFNRFDGWGGFTDPLPYLYAPSMVMVTEEADEFSTTEQAATMPPLVVEHPGMRRP